MNFLKMFIVWKFANFFPHHDILQNFRQINFFTKELYCKSIWRKIFAVGKNFRNFHTVWCQSITVIWSTFFTNWSNGYWFHEISTSEIMKLVYDSHSNGISVKSKTFQKKNESISKLISRIIFHVKLRNFTFTQFILNKIPWNQLPIFVSICWFHEIFFKRKSEILFSYTIKYFVGNIFQKKCFISNKILVQSKSNLHFKIFYDVFHALNSKFLI